MRKAILGSVGALALPHLLSLQTSANPAIAAFQASNTEARPLVGLFVGVTPRRSRDLRGSAPCLRSTTASSGQRISRLCITTRLCSTSVCVPGQVGVADGAIVVTSAAIGERWKGVR